MRDVTKTHPELQKKIKELISLCMKNGIKIKITECVRTVQEQNALYAKGRTAPGSIVTNCKGTSYASPHQWGIAFDFAIYQDVDSDGDIDISDLYNHKLMNVVGKLGQSIGLEWGGSWKSFVDKPHFQLPDWGSTTKKLRSMYKTPEEFMATWSNKKDEEKKNKHLSTTANLRMRTTPDTSTNKNIICTIPKGKKVAYLGQNVMVNKTKWLKVRYNGKDGYCCNKYLK